MRRVVAVGALMSMLGGVMALAVVALGVGPVAASPRTASTRIGQYAMTGAANALSTDGDIGVSGGLITLDSGVASLTTRLDSTPTASVLAQPVRPGSFFETLASLVPSGTPLPTSVPDAEANYPGTGHGSLTLSKPIKVGPFQEVGGSATARASQHSLSSSITGESSSLSPLLTSGAATSSITASASEPTATLKQIAHTTDSKVEVAGVLVLNNVDATASISVRGAKYTESAAVRIGSASVGGVPVSIGSSGIAVVGHGLPLGITTAALTKKVNATLRNAGVTVTAITATTHSGGRSSYANTGGVQITVKTPNLPAGIAGNVFTVTLGSIVLTEQDAKGLPSGPPLPSGSTKPTHHHPSASSTGSGSTTTSTGLPAGSSTGPVSQPPTVAPGNDTGREVALVGHEFTRQQLLAGFAGWQFLSLMTPTLYALTTGRRRRSSTRRVPR